MRCPAPVPDLVTSLAADTGQRSDRKLATTVEILAPIEARARSLRLTLAHSEGEPHRRCRHRRHSTLTAR